MRKLGEQWVEELDGKKHMLKSVEPFELCQGCLFNCNQGGCCWKGFDDCQMGSFFIIKDLGILNDDGCLPCPFCGEYPKIIRYGKSYKYNHLWYEISHHCDVIRLGMMEFKSEQEAIDAWNRRV